jgi:hypothetical protein
MKSRNFSLAIEPDDSVLFQYELLRSQALKKQQIFAERNLGLALFIRQGMLAWIEACHKCIPSNSFFDRHAKTIDLAYEVKSEIIQVLANITLLNLKESQL